MFIKTINKLIGHKNIFILAKISLNYTTSSSNCTEIGEKNEKKNTLELVGHTLLLSF